MSHDWKNVTRYPAELHIPEHDAHDHLVSTVLRLLIPVCVAFGAGYLVHAKTSTPEVAPLPVAGICPDNGDRHDIIEHTWSHRGAVFHRECIRIERPSYVSPRYSVQTPARIM